MLDDYYELVCIKFFCTFSSRIVFASFLVTVEFLGECINVSGIKCSHGVIISTEIPLYASGSEGLLKN